MSRRFPCSLRFLVLLLVYTTPTAWSKFSTHDASSHLGLGPTGLFVGRRSAFLGTRSRPPHPGTLIASSATGKSYKPSKARLYHTNQNRRRYSRINETGWTWVQRLSVINVLAYGLQVWNPYLTTLGIKISEKILNGQELYRLVTPMFLHANLYHLVTNVSSLTAVGPAVENLFGTGRFLATYLVSGVIGNLVSAVQSPNPALGASGAVFGVMSAYVTSLSINERVLGSDVLQLSSGLTTSVGSNLLFGFFSKRVDNWGHLGGCLGGATMAVLFGPRLVALRNPNNPYQPIIMDVPLMRLPRPIEKIPESISKWMQRATRRVRVEYLKKSPIKLPWWDQDDKDYRLRRLVPNRSIPPGTEINLEDYL